jgi:hypothetical protein
MTGTMAIVRTLLGAFLLTACGSAAPAPAGARSEASEQASSIASDARPPRAAVWLEVEGRVRKVATIQDDGALEITVPDLRTSVPRFRRVQGQLQPRAITVDEITAFTLRIDEQGFLRSEPEGLLGDAPIRVVGAELSVGERTYRLASDGSVAPPILEAANLRLRGVDTLSAEQKWLLVAAELAALRGGVAHMVVWGMGEAYGCEGDPNCRGKRESAVSP